MLSQNGSSKADTLVKVVLVFFISLLSFSVGTFVGKQVSDSDHRRMALEGDYKADRSVASADEHGEDHSDKISDKEVESLTEEFVNKEKAVSQAAEADAHNTAATAAHDSHATASADTEGYKTYSRNAAKPEAAKGTAAHDAHGPRKPAATTPASTKPDTSHDSASAKVDAINKAADKVANDKAPTDGMKEEKKAPPQLPSVASAAVGKYTVQVGSYADEKEAKEQASKLKGKGWNAFYLAANVNGKTWYRVLVGLFNNDSSAKEFRAQFMKETNTKDAIVQKIVQ